MKTQFKNSGSALLYQLIIVIVGLILPRFMIQAFGSETYGLGSSVTQFLSYISLIEGGIGGVTRAALYKAFAAKDNDKVSSIIKATDIFFKKVAGIFIVYILALAFIYPRYINSTFDTFFTGSLICIIAISSLAQYCFGITYSIFLQADQKNYISNYVNIVTCILNAVASVVLINFGASFHVVKLVSAAVYTLKPVCFNLYVKKHYNINRKAKADTNALSQRWSGMAHHVAWFLHTNTDVVIITLFGALSDVSIYSVYCMVASGMTKLVTALSSGAEAMFGNMMASEGEDKSRKSFSYYSMFINSAVIILFTTAAGMLMPFISLYTSGITDANYYVPALGYLLLAAEGIYCIRIPYHGIVTAAGQFKQTQSSAILEASINIILSIVLINLLGLPGVALATAVAMLYRTSYYIWYLSKHVLEINFRQNIIRVVGAVLIVVCLSILKCNMFNMRISSYVDWIIQAIIVVLVACLVCVLYNFAFYRMEFITSVRYICKRIRTWLYRSI